MANYNNPANFMSANMIRVPNVYAGFQNNPRIAVRPQHLTMTQNGMVQGVHPNMNTAYVPNMIAMNMNMNSMVNNRLNLQMRIPSLYKQNCPMISKLLSFVDVLGNENMNLQNLQYWKEITSSFFSEDAIMKYTLVDNLNQKHRQFEIPFQVIPRYYQTFFESGVAKIQFILGNPKEKGISIPNVPNGVQFQVDSTSASIEYHFGNGIRATLSGHLTVTFNQTLKMTNFNFVTSKFTEYVPRNLAQKFTSDILVVNEYGMPHKTMRCMEVAEGVDFMQEVMALTIKDHQVGPLHALKMVAQNTNLTPTISNIPNPNQRVLNNQAQLNGKVIKNESSYNGAPPTPNANDLQASAPTPVATPTPVLTPTPTPSLTPSPLVANNGIATGSPRKLPIKSPALVEQSLKRGNDSTPIIKSKRSRSIQKTKNA